MQVEGRIPTDVTNLGCVFWESEKKYSSEFVPRSSSELVLISETLVDNAGGPSTFQWMAALVVILDRANNEIKAMNLLSTEIRSGFVGFELPAGCVPLFTVRIPKDHELPAPKDLREAIEKILKDGLFEESMISEEKKSKKWKGKQKQLSRS